MVDGFPTKESFSGCGFSHFTQFLLVPKYQPYAADMGLNPDNILPEFTGISKFGVYTLDGGLAGYEDQLALPPSMHELSREISAIFAANGNAGENATDATPDVFGYSVRHSQTNIYMCVYIY